MRQLCTSEPLPPNTGLADPGIPDAGWEEHIAKVYEPDRAALAKVWWTALDIRAGFSHRNCANRKAPSGPHASSASGSCATSPKSVWCWWRVATWVTLIRRSSTGSRSEQPFPTGDVAHFERPTWILQELDVLGQVLNTEGDVEDIFGRQPSDMQGNLVLHYIHEGDHPACVEMWSAVLDEPRGSRTIRQRIVRPDHSVRLDRIDRHESPRARRHRCDPVDLP